MLEIITAQNLKTLYRLKHGFFTRKGGVSMQEPYAGLNCGLSSEDTLANTIENRRLVAQQMETEPENLLSCYQIHSPDVVTVTERWLPPNRPRADAMVTRERGLALGILTADCVPLLFADAYVGVIGAAHAGWKGALGGVIENTIKAMEAIGAVRSRIQAAIGPCIWQPSYEVSADFLAPFLAENPDHKKYFFQAPRAGHFMFNLPAYVETKVQAQRVAYVESSPANTATDPERFYSYRRNCLKGDKRVGSLISVIMNTPSPKQKEEDFFKDMESRPTSALSEIAMIEIFS